MAIRRGTRAGIGTASLLAVPVLGYAAAVLWGWTRYGYVRDTPADACDELLDRFMPDYEVVERHSIRVAAPASETFAAARAMDLQDSAIVRAIFKTRELVLGAQPAPASAIRGIVAETTALGWRILAEIPDREIVLGAVTQPWQANVVFRGIPPEDFRAFDTPGYVKIVWTLRADAVGPRASVFRTETRVMTTSPDARRRFRWYWARFSPGIALIRRLTLGPIKANAERGARAE